MAGLIDEAVSLVALGEEPDQWGRLMMRALVAHMDAHPLAGRILRGLEPEFTMRLLQIPALEELRKTVTELLRDHQLAGRVRNDIEPAATANGMVVIVISLLMATLQTGADAGATQRSTNRWPPTWNRCSKPRPAPRSSQPSPTSPLNELRSNHRARRRVSFAMR